MSVFNPATDTAPPVGNTGLMSSLRQSRPPLLTGGLLIAMLLSWHFVTATGRVPEYILPSPAAVWAALATGLSAPPTSTASYWYHTGITLWESIAGLALGAIVGVLLGFALGSWRLLEQVTYPFIVAFQALPKVALAPLLVVWFGLGIDGKIYITAIITFFPLLVSAIAGCHAVEQDRLDLARSCNATRWQILTKIVLPSALPYLFTGLNVASALAVLGAIVGEFVGARAGLGALLMQYNSAMEIGPVFAVLIILGIVGFAMNHAVKLAERHFCFWMRRRDLSSADRG